MYAQSHNTEKKEVFFFSKLKFRHFCSLVSEEQMKTNQTPRAQTQSLRGLETWRIKIMGEVLQMTDSTERASKAGQDRSLCGGPAAALLFNQWDENCHSSQSRGVYWKEDKGEKEMERDLSRGRVLQPVWSIFPWSTAAKFDQSPSPSVQAGTAEACRIRIYIINIILKLWLMIGNQTVHFWAVVFLEIKVRFQSVGQVKIYSGRLRESNFTRNRWQWGRNKYNVTHGFSSLSVKGVWT